MGKKNKIPKLNRTSTFFAGDMSIAIIVAVLTIFGTIMIYSSSYYISINASGTPNYYLFRQLMWLSVGVATMAFFALVDYHIWIKLWQVAYIGGFALLCLLFVIGSNANGSTRWIGLGPITIMPGEVAKMAIIIAVTGYLAKEPERCNTIKGLGTIMAMTGLYAGLIMLQPNMSTAFTIVFIVAGMIFVSGTNMKTIFLLAGAAFAAGVVLIVSDTSGYRYHRLTTMFDPFQDALGNGYQVVQSLLALGTGGLTGLGLGNSVQKNLYLPFPHNDFILSVIGEELGFIGFIVLMMVYLLLVWRGLRIAMNARDYEGMMLGSAIVIMIIVQVILNVAVVTSLMPPTGVILPFVSYGGNALLIFMGAAGMLINISRTADI